MGRHLLNMVAPVVPETYYSSCHLAERLVLSLPLLLSLLLIAMFWPFAGHTLQYRGWRSVDEVKDSIRLNEGMIGIAVDVDVR